MAHMKICSHCNNRSFSSNKKNWVCPICGEDISDVKTSPINNENK